MNKQLKNKEDTIWRKIVHLGAISNVVTKPLKGVIYGPYYMVWETFNKLLRQEKIGVYQISCEDCD